MKSCSKCRKSFENRKTKCPHCGEPAPESAGVFQTSSVRISAGGADLVYRSVDEVPAPLRSKLLKSTNSATSATILIADRRGRKEVSKAVKALPGPAQKRLMHSLIGASPESPKPRLRVGIVAALAALVAAILAFVFLHHWQ
jgi:hypothetical protein